ncbi:MAG TPA: ferrochelatase [Acidimicrobiales bacterium]
MIGVVLMAYGTPAGPADVEAYYTHIRRGRPPSADELADLQARYDAIGGVSPLAERTEAQRARLQETLDNLAPGRFRVALGNKHAAPFIEDTVASLIADGAERLVGLVLAPHYSRGSVGEYRERLDASAAAAAAGLPVAMIERWYDLPALHEFLARAVTDALAAMPERTKVLFTAHSLPVAVLDGDPYEDELRASATAVAARAGLPRWAGWTLAWQSAARTPMAWKGPDILEVIRDLAATGRADGVVVCPQGFTSDHLEVLYDLDIRARSSAEEAGLAFARTRSVNDDPTVFGELAAVVAAAV